MDYIDQLHLNIIFKLSNLCLHVISMVKKRFLATKQEVHKIFARFQDLSEAIDFTIDMRSTDVEITHSSILL